MLCLWPHLNSNSLLFYIHLIFHFCYYASSTFIITMMGFVTAISQHFLFLFSCTLTLSILPQAWRCHSADFLLDPLKWILVKPFGLKDLFKSLCGVQGLPEAIRAVESWAATGTSCTLELRPQVKECPPKHGSTVCSQCYCAEEMSITGTLEVTGKFTDLSF